LPAELPRRRAHADIYTVLLVVALLVILLATGLLWALMRVYDYKIKGGPIVLDSRPAASATAQFALQSGHRLC
jgi:hypothetical protein